MSSDLSETTSEESCSQMSEREINCDSNAQFPSPDHVFTETPAYITCNLMASQTYPMSQSSSEENIKSDATAQTDITFPKNLPESVQKILNTYSICSEQKSKTKLRSTGEEVDNSDNPECVQQQNYDYDLPSPPYSDFDCQLVEPQDYVPEDPNMYAIEHEANSNNEI
ncbi:uncharacterized protein LOC106715946 isoform X2 [Papilio machaon]|uniref:uncharacterized protein LOC106715946 isoform X2 n=1 Tax=Papilio machaon TaxID=76193 RepID=UPI001E662B8B|nr:uncharacterized protein LOC106715946 isoform X2 [Papilio machaon]